MKHLNERERKIYKRSLIVSLIFMIVMPLTIACSTFVPYLSSKETLTKVIMIEAIIFFAWHSVHWIFYGDDVN